MDTVNVAVAHTSSGSVYMTLLAHPCACRMSSGQIAHRVRLDLRMVGLVRGARQRGREVTAREECNPGR